jgi:hypothetical protein
METDTQFWLRPNQRMGREQSRKVEEKQPTYQQRHDEQAGR